MRRPCTTRRPCVRRRTSRGSSPPWWPRSPRFGSELARTSLIAKLVNPQVGHLVKCFHVSKSADAKTNSGHKVYSSSFCSFSSNLLSSSSPMIVLLVLFIFSWNISTSADNLSKLTIPSRNSPPFPYSGPTLSNFSLLIFFLLKADLLLFPQLLTNQCSEEQNTKTKGWMQNV